MSTQLNLEKIYKKVISSVSLGKKDCISMGVDFQRWGGGRSPFLRLKLASPSEAQSPTSKTSDEHK